MHIAYSTDEGFVRHAYVSMASLLDANSDEPSIVLHVIDLGIAPRSREALQSLVARHDAPGTRRELRFIDFEPYRPRLEGIVDEKRYGMFGRFFLADMVADSDRVLYLDCDTAICDSLHDLYCYDLGAGGAGADAGAVAMVGVLDFLGWPCRRATGLQPADSYINSGVLLVNLAYWREHDVCGQLLEFRREHGDDIPYDDQGVLNNVLRGRIALAEPRFNAMMNDFMPVAAKSGTVNAPGRCYTADEFARAREHPAVVHYNRCRMFLRPWYRALPGQKDHPMCEAYRRYMDAEDSPWKGDYLEMQTSALSKVPPALLNLAYTVLPARLAVWFQDRYTDLALRFGI